MVRLHPQCNHPPGRRGLQRGSARVAAMAASASDSHGAEMRARDIADVVVTRRGGVPVRRWIVDPIDGTKNYVRGVPVWATLIALADADGIALGFVSAPALGRRWWATRDGGAFTRDVDGSTRAIHVSAVANVSDASFSFSDAVGWDLHGEAGPTGLQTLVSSAWRTRGYGDFLSHMLVAEGAVDIAAEPQLAPWDVAALVPIVEAAGGRMTGYDGRSCLESGSGLTSNGLLHDYALGLFR